MLARLKIYLLLLVITALTGNWGALQSSIGLLTRGVDIDFDAVQIALACFCFGLSVGSLATAHYVRRFGHATAIGFSAVVFAVFVLLLPTALPSGIVSLSAAPMPMSSPASPVGLYIIMSLAGLVVSPQQQAALLFVTRWVPVSERARALWTLEAVRTCLGALVFSQVMVMDNATGSLFTDEGRSATGGQRPSTEEHTELLTGAVYANEATGLLLFIVGILWLCLVPELPRSRRSRGLRQWRGGSTTVNERTALMGAADDDPPPARSAGKRCAAFEASSDERAHLRLTVPPINPLDDARHAARLGLERPAVPWFALLRSPATFAFAMCAAASRVSLFVLLTSLPTYVGAHNLLSARVSCALTAGSAMLLGGLVGALADCYTTRRQLFKPVTRLFVARAALQAASTVGCALVFFVMWIYEVPAGAAAVATILALALCVAVGGTGAAHGLVAIEWSPAHGALLAGATSIPFSYAIEGSLYFSIPYMVRQSSINSPFLFAAVANLLATLVMLVAFPLEPFAKE